MIIGPVANSVCIIAGSLLGSLCGPVISADLRQKFITVFSCITLGIGVTMLGKGDSLPPVVLSILLGTCVGEAVHLESNVMKVAFKAAGLFRRDSKKSDSIPETVFRDQFAVVTVLFCVSGLGVLGSIREGLTGEYALLLIKGILDLADGKDADVVIEAAVENIELKKKIFAELDSVIKEGAILASNTSSLSITAIASATKRPDKVVGMHFFNPVPVMALVEVIRGIATSDATYRAIVELAKQLGKSPVTVEEAPGFVVNRILIPMINEAAFMVMENVATPEDIDTAMKLGANHPMGPLALGDLIGLDVCLAIMEVMTSETGDGKYRPAPLLRKMVRAGYLGRKTGRGFFTYA